MDFKEVIDPSLEIFESPAIDHSISEMEYIEYEQRDTQMNKPAGGKYTIETKDLDEYLHPHKAMLYVRGRIQNYNDPAAPASYAVGAKITLNNNGWSLFHTIQYQIDNHVVEDINLYLPQASTTMNILMFSDDYSRSSGSNKFWFKDTGVGSAESDEYVTAAVALPSGTVGDGANATGAQLRAALDARKNASYNQGFASRRILTDNGKMVSFFLSLQDVLGSHKDIDTAYRSVKHTYILTRAEHSNYIHAADGITNSDKAQFTIQHISIWMPKIRPSLQVLSMLEAALASNAVKKLYFEQVNIYRRTFQSNETVVSWRVATNTGVSLPTHIFLCFQSSTQDNDVEQNNQVFKHGKLQRASCWINSVQYPEREYECDFGDNTLDIARIYMSFQSAVGKYSDVDSGSQISIADYKNLYPIIHFDVSKHRDRLNVSTADVTLKWRLGGAFEYPTGTRTAYNAYCLILSDRFMTLQGVNGKMSVIV